VHHRAAREVRRARAQVPGSVKPRQEPA
jgi:hypothetical protein